MAEVYQTWGNVYQHALDETDLQKLPARVAIAEQALRERLRELAVSPNDHEQQAIDGAIQELLKIKSEKLKWPVIVPTKVATENHWTQRPPLNYSKTQR